MTKNKFLLITSIFICSNSLFAQIDNNKCDSSLYEVQKWFKAWDLVYKDIYGLKEIKPVDFVLFDETYLYTTSITTGKNGVSIIGPSLSGQSFAWIKKIHNGKVKLPNGEEEDIKVMCFASPVENGHPFFVMPLTSYWHKNKIDDHGIGLDMLVICVFLHEFAHTQQMQSFNDIGIVMEAYSKLHPDDNLSDDILQDYYQNDSLYVKDYKLETDLFRQASFAEDKNECIQLTKKALQMLKDRQNKCFEKDNRDISKMDNFFLTLEGVGQYNAFSWLVHLKGGNLEISDALKAIKTNSWSQEQGFDTIFLLSKYMKPKRFSKYMFGQKMTTSIELLEKQVAK